LKTSALLQNPVVEARGQVLQNICAETDNVFPMARGH